jgi:hypothetical protein
MHMVFLHVERAYRPAVRCADATDFLFDKRGKLAYQKLFPIFGAPDKIVSKLIGDVFGMLYIHTRQHHICSNPCEVFGGPPYSYLKDRGIRLPDHETAGLFMIGATI